MNPALPIKIKGKPRILVAPLDWGLGHATRCIPIIQQLLAKDCDVWLAGERAQESLLRSEFPSLPFLPLEGYRISYSKSAAGLPWKMAQQSLKIRRAIRKENEWLNGAIDEYELDAVISDNRYGLYNKRIPSILISHQLLVKTHCGEWTERLLQQFMLKWINRFTSCWVPDFRGNHSLAGQLSHPVRMPAIPVHYIGQLSRLEKTDQEVKKGHIVVLLSGPEPQRSILEEIIIREISHYNHTATVVRGLPGERSIVPSTNMIKFYNHLPSTELNQVIDEAEYVISRSGYSTVMDLVKLQKKSILIPTPGQTEQQYLGKYLMEKRIALCVQQDKFSLTKSLAAASSFDYDIPDLDSFDQLEKTVDLFLGLLPRKSKDSNA